MVLFRLVIESMVHRLQKDCWAKRFSERGTWEVGGGEERCAKKLRNEVKAEGA